MTNEMATVCSQLDETLLMFFEVLAKLKVVQQQAFVRIKEGLINMAEARFEAVTSFELSKNSYEGRDMHATVRVNKGVDGWSVCGDEEVEEVPSSVRRRREKADNEDDGDSKRSVGADSPSGVDPLQWFGVLVPPHLRIAKTQFEGSLSSLVEQCTLHDQLRDLEKRYISLLQTKKQLKEMEHGSPQPN